MTPEQSQHLRDICEGKIELPLRNPEPEQAVKACSECDGAMVGKAIKGRGMVYACADVSCPMYGREQKA